MFSKCLIQFSVYGWAVFPPCYLSGPSYGGGSEDNGDLLPKVPCMHCHTQCPQPCRRPLTHASAGGSWTLTSKSGSVSCGVTAPFSWVLGHRLCLCPPRVCFPVPCKFWRPCGGVNGDLLQEGLCHTQVYCTLSLRQAADPHLHRRHSDTVLSQSLGGSLRPGAHKVCLSPLSGSGRYGV